MGWLISIWEYVLVFVLAAIPWIEILVVIPIAIIQGLNPILVAVMSFSGNFLTVFILIVLFEKYQKWRSKKKDITEQDKKPSKRTERAKDIWYKYGVPGLSFAGPIITGSHVAVIIGMVLGAKKYSMTTWMTISLGIWTLAITVVSYYGLDFFNLI
ncbi:hypothetical protein SYNTR_0038 [Candidatus Syntrophocurvum alkaliphilum]|uniref:DNA-binding protein n=1 Tax=Candidatus Syntrophocurvum alkaliphilum TaxID=2293317 RepID=A0A6I6DDG6_9FIRM|nr:small multi-drug export protein [Candidatus Syntrophocurvum alkaliphilum]QGT98631.1 hypothetical protein SYNTR_0038 [Candidatus Syntrophocurvum alkaliphilum]